MEYRGIRRPVRCSTGHQRTRAADCRTWSGLHQRRWTVAICATRRGCWTCKVVASAFACNVFGGRRVKQALSRHDYMTKTSSPGELATRVKVRRRRPRLAGEVAATLQAGLLTVDRPRRPCACSDQAVELTVLELAVVAALASVSGRVLVRRALVEGRGDPGTRYRTGRWTRTSVASGRSCERRAGTPSRRCMGLAIDPGDGGVGHPWTDRVSMGQRRSILADRTGGKKSNTCHAGDRSAAADRCRAPKGNLAELAGTLAGRDDAVGSERTTDEPKPPLMSIRRRGEVRVFVAVPLFRYGAVVRASRTACDPMEVAWRHRRLLLEALLLSGAGSWAASPGPFDAS